MNKTLKLLIVFLFPLAINSQEIKIKLRNIKDVYQIVNHENNNALIFFIENKKITSYLLGDNLETIDSISLERPEKKFKSIAGHTYNNDIYSLVWETDDQNEFHIQEIDLKSRKITNKFFSSEPLENETIKTMQEKDKLIFICLNNKNNVVKIISFDKNNNFENKKIDLSSLNFENSKGATVKFKDILAEKTGNKQAIIDIIDKDLPNSLVKTSNKKKLYHYNNKILLAFDNNSYSSQIVSINLNNYSFSYFEIKNHLMKKGIKTEYNSFIIDDFCYGLNTSESRFTIFIKDFNNNILLEKSFSNEEEITFKNSDLIQIGGEFINERKLSDTKQFLRKVNSLNPSISVYPLNGNYMMTLGSVSDERYSGMAGLFGAGGVFLYYAIHNPTYESFLSYSNRKVVYFNTIMDKNFVHRAEPAEPLAFDKIETFTKRNDELKYFTIFKKQANYVFGYYSYEQEKYFLRKITD
jgi:hypothetical protein